MPFSMSPRRSWRSMLTSFGCEQIVQVRATEQLQERRTCRAPVEIYSGTGQSGATAKRAQYRGGNASGCRDAFVVALLQLRVLRLGFLQDRDVGVGVFPESEEILVGSAGFGRIAI